MRPRLMRSFPLAFVLLLAHSGPYRFVAAGVRREGSTRMTRFAVGLS
jgi:hypothetical protein